MGMLRTLRLEDLCSTVQLDEALECPGRQNPQDSRLVQLYRALATGDATALRTLLKRSYVDVNVLFEVKRDELVWQAQDISTFGASGLWSLEYKREVTSPLCMAAAQGYTECLRYLLEHGARPNLTAGGKAALHEACENGNADCAELLLERGASPSLATEDGLTPLHLCRSAQSLRCAKALVRYGAKVDQSSEEDSETPLHVAARHGRLHHARLYLRYGAEVNHASTSGETPLGVACAAAQDPALPPEHLQLCHLLLAHGANPNLADEERRTQGGAQRAARPGGAAAGARGRVNLRNQCAIFPHNMCLSPMCRVCFRAQVLTACAAAPETVEVLFNSYSQVPVTYKWMESIPEDLFQVEESRRAQGVPLPPSTALGAGRPSGP
ncbi:ankyrin repeat and SOCS box protein 18-like [Scleropages formosus]|uniref:Ankyrin repeat and SOCS box protein 18-like n=1 Tax=Scleropages formosus TaxID=113540 RepID=A0A0P7UJS1_SCLFO|nr:ankyrin repeat and SOCS box protein 18-like [Scleropages formosus]